MNDPERSAPRLRPFAESDLDAVLALNNAAVPHVNALTVDDWREILGDADCVLIAETGEPRDGPVPGNPGGVLVAVPPGTGYDSANYRWLGERFDDFLYIDRIVIAETARGFGLGRLLYEALAARGRERGVARLVCEVNVEPPNPGSIAFHERMGFRAIGDQLNPQSGKTVRYFEKPLT